MNGSSDAPVIVPSGTYSPSFVLYNASAANWPVPNVTVFNMTVVAEDGVSTKTYWIRVVKVVDEPTDESFWMSYYQVGAERHPLRFWVLPLGCLTWIAALRKRPQITLSNYTTVAIPGQQLASTYAVGLSGNLTGLVNIPANSTLTLTVQVNTTKWALEVLPYFPRLAGDYYPTTAMNFTIAYGPGNVTFASNLTVTKQGTCPSGSAFE